MSLKKSELEIYKKITEGKMNKEEIEKYLQEDDLREQEKAEKLKKDEMEKQYPTYLAKDTFNEFWEEIPRSKKLPSRQSQSVKRASIYGPHPRTEEEKNEWIRKRYSALPEITKNTVVTRREIDLSLIAEDPVFGDFRKKNIPKRLIEDDMSHAFKSMMSPRLPKKSMLAHSVMPTHMPKLVDSMTPGPDKLAPVQT